MLSRCCRRTSFRPIHICYGFAVNAKPNNRRFLNSALDPNVRTLVQELADQQPCFAMHSSNVTILHEPSQFYQCLLDMIHRAKRRVFLSSLYIGSEEIELIEALQTALDTNPSLQVRLHLDLNRSTRPGPKSTVSLLLPLLQAHPHRVNVSLFRSPQLKGLMARLVPPRYNEGWGTWHPKIYGVDDDVLISGANMNESYFSNRQDRYILLSSQHYIAQYCHAFLQAAASFSYRLLPSPESRQRYELVWSDTTTHPHHIERKAENALTVFQNTYRLTSTYRVSQNTVSQNDGKPDVLIFPIIQAGQFNIREEERVFNLLFNELSNIRFSSKSGETSYDGPLIDLTSGYFGLYHRYRDLILRSQLACRIIAASPKANGFYGSSGLSSRLPEGYTLLEQRFMKAVREAGEEWPVDSLQPPVGSGVQLREWERDGWTYHAKGIWVRPTPTATPYMTLFGSTNLNSRSANIDTELSFLLVTSSNSLRNWLAEEVDALRAHTVPWRGERRKVSLGTKALVSVVGSML